MNIFRKLFAKPEPARSGGRDNPENLAQMIAALNDQRALGSRALDGSGKPPCDICSVGFERDEGYLLTTTEVVRSEEYWSFAFANSMALFHSIDPSGGSLAMMLSTIAKSATPWRVCEACIGLFNVDKDAANRHSRAGTLPSGTGASELKIAAMPAAYAWAKAYHNWPLSIQVGSYPITHDTNAGTPCDFCTRITVDPNAAVGLVSSMMLADFETKARIRRIGPARLHKDGQDFWMACSSCLERYGGK